MDMACKTFPATDECLPTALSFAEESLFEIGCKIGIIMQITVCIEEMFVNVAHYAYTGGNGTVTLSLEKEDESVSITLRDKGVAFDPLAKKDPDITLSADDRPIGGLGIFMVKKSMDAVEYRRQNGENIFTMKKRITQ